jgi:preprotein translocase subunit SecE
VARDRQRAKRRRAERKSGSGGTDDLARDIGLGPDGDAVESPLGEGTAAPDPLRNSSAEVDEARLAESGLTPPDAEYGEEGEIYPDELGADDDEHAPDEVEGDAPVRRRAGSVAVEHDRERRSGPRFIVFLGHCVDELRRVQWPNRKQVGQATAVVLGFVVIAGGYLGLLDALWKPLIEAIL